jgi:hypothetical protein
MTKLNRGVTSALGGATGTPGVPVAGDDDPRHRYKAASETSAVTAAIRRFKSVTSTGNGRDRMRKTGPFVDAPPSAPVQKNEAWAAGKESLTT